MKYTMLLKPEACDYISDLFENGLPFGTVVKGIDYGEAKSIGLIAIRMIGNPISYAWLKLKAKGKTIIVKGWPSRIEF